MTRKGDGELSAQAAPKYGTSAVRDIHYVTGAKEPYVQVKQRKNGQYVVIERLPVHHRPRNHGLPTLQQSLAEAEVKLNSLKPGWMPTPKVKEAGRGGSSPPALPPIDLGWKNKAQALVGSLNNVHHEPGGGNKAIPRQRVAWEARAKVGSLDNLNYKAGARSTTSSQSDPVRSPRRQMQAMLEASPRYGALAHCGAMGPNMHYTPGGAEVLTTRPPRRFQHVRPRVGSLDNIAHVPGGGEVALETRPTRWRSEARVGSLENVHHVPSGGAVSIVNRRLSWQAKPRVGSLDNVGHKPQLSPITIPRNRLSWLGRPRVGSLDNVHHKPGGGLVNITNNRLRWNAQPKVDSKPPKRRMSHGSSLESLDSCEAGVGTRLRVALGSREGGGVRLV